MLEAFIKYFFIIFCSFYLYRKLLNLSTTKNTILIECISSFISAVLLYFIRLHLSPISIFFTVITFTIIVYLLYKQPINVTLISSLISISFSYTLHLLFTIPLTPIIVLILQPLGISTYYIPLFIIGLSQILFTKILFCFPRFKNGMPFLKNQASNDMGVYITIYLLVGVSFFSISKTYSYTLIIPTFFILISGILIFFWWKHKLTETYLIKLNERKISEFEKQIVELRESHDTLAKIIHKDNKLIPTMVFELQNVLTEAGSHLNEEDRMEIQHALNKLNTLAQERKGLIQLDESKAKSAYITGSLAIDSLLKYLAAKAYSQQIMFEVMISANVTNILPDIISEADFRTIVADLVENAFIAVKQETKRNVLFHTSIENDIFYMDIYDSGTPFAKEVLEKMGKEAITTHKNEGGSGIGYMSTFEILNRCNGALDIDEHLDMETYTKRVSVFFHLYSS